MIPNLGYHVNAVSLVLTDPPCFSGHGLGDKRCVDQSLRIDVAHATYHNGNEMTGWMGDWKLIFDHDFLIESTYSMFGSVVNYLI